MPHKRSLCSSLKSNQILMITAENQILFNDNLAIEKLDILPHLSLLDSAITDSRRNIYRENLSND